MKLGNLYDLASFETFADGAKAEQAFSDSYAGTVLARNLTHVSAKIFEKKFPELAFVNSGVQADNSGGYARRIQSLRIQDLGGFTNSGDTSDNKGKISIAGEDSYLKVIEREAHSKWTDSEIEEAALQNLNLQQRYVQATNRIYMREVDQIGLVGIDGGPASGLLNYAGFVSGAATGAASSQTAQQMYDEAAGLITDQWNAVNNTPEYKADRFIMPTSVMNRLNSTLLDTSNTSNITVLGALQTNFPTVQFMGTFRAEDVGGASATAAYSSNAESMIMRIPLALRIGEVIKLGSFDFQSDYKYRIAGLDVLENASGRILTGW